MTINELIALIESERETYGIESFALVDGTYTIRVKRGYETLAARRMAQLQTQYPDLISGGNTKTE